MTNPLNVSSEVRREVCAEHGDYESRNVFGKIWSTCITCTKDAIAKAKQKEDEDAKAARVASWRKQLTQAAIPERFMDRSLDTYVALSEGQRKALGYARHFAGQFIDGQPQGRSAIFCGHPGTGKTHLAVGIGLHLMSIKKLVLFITVQRMVRKMKDSWRKDSTQSESDVIDFFVKPDLLIIDEIGVQFGTEFEKNFIFDVLNERYEKRKSTLLLSNLTGGEVKAFLGERVYDRLREDGGKCIPFDWTSHRGQHAA